MTADDGERTVMVDMDQVLSPHEEMPLRLRQISGPSEGRTFRVLLLQEVAMGRDESCQIRLEGKSISRHHAKISYLKHFPEIMDLGSVNGTFVNGKRVEKAPIHDGDNLQIGPYSFEIALGQGSPTDSLATPMSPEKLKRVQHALDSSVGMKAKLFRHRSAFSGQLQEIGLMSLLQTIGANKRTGSLSIQFESEKGAVYLEKGELVHATLGRAFGPKAFYRMVKFEKGSFEFFTPGRKPDDRTFEGSVESHMLEAARHLDEFTAYRDQLPDDEARLVFAPKVMIDLCGPSLHLFSRSWRRWASSRLWGRSWRSAHCPI